MDYKAWYRQWRPVVFENVIGQDPIVRTLRNQIKSGRIAHAYLFCGPKGTGKTSVARILAHAANCLSPQEGSPCWKCAVCENSLKGDIDIVEIDAASNNGVDDIRELKDRVKYPPVNGRYKVYIVDEVHMLSIGAFNALLKTLEEPPGHILFIFATTESHKLPATILSRCQRFNFRRIPNNSIVTVLKEIAAQIKIEYEESALETIALWSEGSLRDAISLLDQSNGFRNDILTNKDVLTILGTVETKAIFMLTDSLISGDVQSMLKQIASFMEQGGDMSVILRDLINHLRNVLVIKMCDLPETILDDFVSYKEDYLKQAQTVSVQKLAGAVEQLSAIESEMRWSTQPRILLELALIKICRQESLESQISILERIQQIEKRLAEISSSEVQKSIQSNVRAGEVISVPEVSGIKKRDNVESQLSASRKDEQKPTPINPAVKEKNPLNDWHQILKTIRAQRESIYSFLEEVKPEMESKHELKLVFPQGREFNVEYLNKPENRKFLEDVVSNFCGKQYNLKLRVRESTKSEKLRNAENSLVQKTYELFGKENVEIIDA